MRPGLAKSRQWTGVPQEKLPEKKDDAVVPWLFVKGNSLVNVVIPRDCTKKMDQKNGILMEMGF